jgi:HSP20 family protein
MAIRRWEPFPSINRLYDEMDRMFESFFGPVLPHRRGETQTEGYRIPMVDLSEAEGEFVLKAELPGVSKENLDIEVQDDRIMLKAQTSEEKETTEGSYHRRERSYRSFQRVIPLPAEVKSGEAKASFKDGLLEVHLPKATPAATNKPVKVEIS